MQTRAISIACPVCGSAEIVYSCEPKCCFNHVCAECRASFQTGTRLAGGRANGAVPPNPLPDCTEPTAACAKCESTRVYALEDGKLVCADCGLLLELELSEICPA